MASDKKNYNSEVYATLSESERELIMGEGRETGENLSLVILWNALRKIEAKGDLLNKWILHLPAAYAQILPQDILTWLWDNADVTTVPASLTAEDKIVWPTHLKLHSMHICRRRANMKGCVSMSDYAVLLNSRTKYAVIYNGTEDFFSTKKRDEGILDYNEELSQVIKELLLDTGRYYLANNTHSDLESRYVLRKWSVSPLSYEPNSKTLFLYALGLIQEFYYRIHKSPLLDLPYYQENFRGEWVPGTTFVPGTLRDAVNGLMEEECPSLGPNVTFIRNYYASAGDVVLQSLHNNLAKQALEKMNKGSCSIQ